MIGSEHVAHHVDFCYLEPKFYLLRNCFWVPTWIAGAHVLELPCAAFSRHIIRELDQKWSGWNLYQRAHGMLVTDTDLTCCPTVPVSPCTV